MRARKFEMSRFVCIFSVLLTCIFLPTLSSAWAKADFYAPAQGTPIVMVRGAITATNSADGLVLDLDQLKSLPQHSFTTSTPWTEAKATFQGVLLKDFIAAVGATGTTVTITALDDYTNSIPITDAKDDGPMLAFLKDGELISIRDKGPLWLIYPFDDNAEYQTEETYAHSVWQIARIEFGN